MIPPVLALAAGNALALTKFVALDDLYAMFEQVCVANTELADQQRAARGIYGVKMSQSQGNPKVDRKYVPRTRYVGDRFQVEMIGFAGDITCVATAHISPTVDAATFRENVAMHFGAKPSTAMSGKDFYHGGFNLKSRLIEIEWARKDREVIALLSIRKRPGFAR